METQRNDSKNRYTTEHYHSHELHCYVIQIKNDFLRGIYLRIRRGMRLVIGIDISDVLSTYRRTNHIPLSIGALGNFGDFCCSLVSGLASFGSGLLDFPRPFFGNSKNLINLRHCA